MLSRRVIRSPSGTGKRHKNNYRGGETKNGFMYPVPSSTYERKRGSTSTKNTPGLEEVLSMKRSGKLAAASITMKKHPNKFVKRVG